MPLQQQMPTTIAAISVIGLVAVFAGDDVSELLCRLALGTVVSVIAQAVSKWRK